MGRWVTIKGRRIYIPDEGEENPYFDKNGKKITKEPKTKYDLGGNPIIDDEMQDILERHEEGEKLRRQDIEEKKKQKQIAENKKQADERNGKSSSRKKFSADKASKSINQISQNHNNGGGDINNDWKQVRSTLDSVPHGTVMIETGNRGMTFQYTKNKDGSWTNDSDGRKTDSKLLSMSWVGQGYRPSIKFTTSDKSMSKEQIKDTHTAAVNGMLNQRLGLDKNGKPINRRKRK